MIWAVAGIGELHTLEELTSKGVDVTGIVFDTVSMCVAISTLNNCI